MTCAECEYCKKTAMNIPVFCRYDGHNYFLFHFDNHTRYKPSWCPYVKNGEDWSGNSEHEDSKPDLD